MSVDQTDKVDFIGVDEASDAVALGISDHHEWGHHEHLVLLQEKVNAYLRFLESGEVYEAYPEAKGRRFVIELLLQHEPDPEGVSFLGRVKKTLEEGGFSFRFRRVTPTSD